MKKLIFILSLITFNLQLPTFVSSRFGGDNLFAQLVQQEWVARYPGPSNDFYGPFFALDKYGNSYVGGTHVPDTINILCVKYNTSGVQQWARLYKYPGECPSPAGLAIDTLGNPYITALSGPSCLPPRNILTVKFSGATGAIVWARKYIGQYGESYCSDIKIDRLNNIYVVGYSDSSLLCIKYNTNGDSVWVRRWQPPGDYAVAIACTVDDSLNIIMTGRRSHCVSFPPPGGCFDTLLTVKYAADGTLRWIRTYYSPTFTNGNKIVADQYGSAYIGGITTISGYGVYLTLKYDRNGIFQWAKIYDGPGNGDDIIGGIAMDRIHNFLFVTGRSSSSNTQSFCATVKYNASTGDSVWVRRDTGTYRNGSAGDVKTDSSGNAYITGATNNIPPGSAVDVLTIKYSPQGNVTWLIAYNGPYNGGDAGYALRLDTLNNVYVMDVSQSSPTVFDYIVIKYSQLVGVQPLNNEVPSVFKLYQNYPNPFNSKSNIKYKISKTSFVSIKVFDILGREIVNLVDRELKPGTYQVDFDGTNYASGLYFYKLITDGNIIDTKKLVLLK